MRSRGYKDEEIRRDLEAFKTLLSEVPLNSNVLIKASKLRDKYELTYFDSLHAASAIITDRIIISIDKDYERVKELNAIKPDKFI